MCANNDDWTVRRPCLDVDEPLLDLVHALLAVRDLPNDLFGEKKKNNEYLNQVLMLNLLINIYM